MHSYFPVLVTIIFAAVVIGFFWFVSVALGPRRRDPVKDQPFECGNPPVGSARQPLSVSFYVTALLFLLFDVETIYLLPWAVVYRRMGVFALVEMGIFVLVLVVGLAYAWAKGALEWD